MAKAKAGAEEVPKAGAEEAKDPNKGSGKFYYPSGATYEGEWILVPEGESIPPYPPKPPLPAKEEPPTEDSPPAPLGPPPPAPPPEQVRPNRKRNGQGIYIDGAYEYSGEWQNDFMHGQGCFKYASGSSYDGQWEHNIYMGLGTYTWSNGAKYTGSWKDNKMHGDGMYIDEVGNIWPGQFFNGEGPGLIRQLQ